LLIARRPLVIIGPLTPNLLLTLLF